MTLTARYTEPCQRCGSRLWALNYDRDEWRCMCGNRAYILSDGVIQSGQRVEQPLRSEPTVQRGTYHIAQRQRRELNVSLPDRSELADRVRAHIAANGITRNAFARQCGIDVGCVRRLLDNYQSLATPTVAAITTALEEQR